MFNFIFNLSFCVFLFLSLIKAQSTTDINQNCIDLYHDNINNDWTCNYGEFDNITSSKMIHTYDGGYILTGTEKPGDSSDIYLLKLDADGDVEWYKVYGGNGSDAANSVIKVNDGYVIIGSTRSYSGNDDIWIIKTDLDGYTCDYSNNGSCSNLNQWVQIYDYDQNGNNQIGRDAVWSNINNEYAILTQMYNSENSSYDIGLYILDEYGNEVHSRLYGDISTASENDIGYSIIEDVKNMNNGYIITGYTLSYGNKNPGDLWVFKVNNDGQSCFQNEGNWHQYNEICNEDDFYDYNSNNIFDTNDTYRFNVNDNCNGNCLDTLNGTWAKTYGGLGTDYGLSINHSQDSSSFIITGFTNSFSNDYNLWLLNIDPSNLDNHCNYNFVEKLTYDFNSNGEYDSNDLFQDDNDNEIWDNYYGHCENSEQFYDTNDNGTYDFEEEFIDCGIDLDNNPICSDEVGWQSSFGNGTWDDAEELIDLNGNNIWDNAEDFIDENGNGVWDLYNDNWFKIYGNDLDDGGRSVSSTLDGGYIIAGESFNEYKTAYDSWILKTDTYGNLIWDLKIGGDKDDFFNSVLVDINGNGYTLSGASISYSQNENYNILVTKLGTDDCSWMGDNAQIDECGVCCNCDENTDDCTEEFICSYYNSPDEYGGAYDCNGNCFGNASVDENHSYSVGEEYIDDNNNGEYDIGEEFTDCNDDFTLCDGMEGWTDDMGNGEWDFNSSAHCCANIDRDSCGECFGDNVGCADIIINEIMKNPSYVTDSQGEWFELYNNEDTDRSLKNWKISDDKDNPLEEFIIDEDLIIPAKGYVVIGNNADFSTNGGINIDYEYAYSDFTLFNGADKILLMSRKSNLSYIVRDKLEWGLDSFEDEGYSYALKNTENFIPYCEIEEEKCFDGDQLVSDYTDSVMCIENGLTWGIAQNEIQCGNICDLDEYNCQIDHWIELSVYNDDLENWTKSKRLNGNGIWDDAEQFTDENGNGIWDRIEEFIDKNGNGIWDGAEQFTDENGNGIWDNAEEFIDENGNGIWDINEVFIDKNCNGYWDSAEQFIDCASINSDFSICSIDSLWQDTLGNGIWDDAEEFFDLNGNNIWDDAEEFIDCGLDNYNNLICSDDISWQSSFGNGTWDNAEIFFDCQINNLSFCENNENWIPGLGNGIYDEGEPFIDEILYPGDYNSNKMPNFDPKVNVLIDEINFSYVMINDSKILDFYITNEGYGDLIIKNISLISLNDEVFECILDGVSCNVNDDNEHILFYGNNDTLNIQISFSPNEIETNSNILYFETNDYDNSFKQIQISGQGYESQPIIDVDSILEFDDYNESKSLNIKNTGQEILNIEEINFINDNFYSSFIFGSILPSENINIDINYKHTNDTITCGLVDTLIIYSNYQAEQFSDLNNNEQWDYNEPYVDINANLQWDSGIVTSVILSLSNDESINYEIMSFDLNGDSNIDVIDVINLVDIILGFSELQNGDYNNDGNIDIIDITVLMDYILSN